MYLSEILTIIYVNQCHRVLLRFTGFQAICSQICSQKCSQIIRINKGFVTDLKLYVVVKAEELGRAIPFIENPELKESAYELLENLSLMSEKEYRALHETVLFDAAFDCEETSFSQSTVNKVLWR